MTATTAALTDKIEQRDRALAKANRVRLGNARRCRSISELPIEEAFAAAAAILRDPQGDERSMRVGMLLLALPRVGRAKLRQLLRRVVIGSADTYVGSLTDRQRHDLATLLDNPRRIWPNHSRPNRKLN